MAVENIKQELPHVESTKVPLVSKIHSTEVPLVSKAQSTKVSLESKAQSTEVPLVSKAQSTKVKLESKTQSTEVPLVSKAQSAKVQLVSKTQYFTFRQLASITKDFETFLGKGASGEVYRGYLKDQRKHVAVKKLFSSDTNISMQFQTEVSCLNFAPKNLLVDVIYLLC